MSNRRAAIRKLAISLKVKSSAYFVHKGATFIPYTYIFKSSKMIGELLLPLTHM